MECTLGWLRKACSVSADLLDVRLASRLIENELRHVVDGRILIGDGEGNLVDDATVMMTVHVIGWRRLAYSALARIVLAQDGNRSLTTTRITSPMHMFLSLI